MPSRPKSYPKRPGHPARPGDAPPLKTILGFVAVCLAVAGLGAAAYFKSANDADRGEDYCSKNKGPGQIVALAIDLSDPFDAVQTLNLQNKIREMIGTLQRGDRLDIYEVNAPQGGLATRTFSMCNPGDPTTFEAVTSNENDAEGNYKAKFAESLDHALKAAQKQQTAPQSPILESLRSLAPTSFPGEVDAASKRIILVSDMIQNTGTYSMFKSGTADFDTFMNSPNYARAATDFRKAKFDLLVVSRVEYAKHQTRSLLLWWEQYISANNGELLGYKRI